MSMPALAASLLQCYSAWRSSSGYRALLPEILLQNAVQQLVHLLSKGALPLQPRCTPAEGLACSPVPAYQLDAELLICRYVHRVGRTARMGQQGMAMLLLLPQEVGYIQKLQQQGVKLQEQALLPLLDQLPPPGAGFKVGSSGVGGVVCWAWCAHSKGQVSLCISCLGQRLASRWVPLAV